MSDWEIVKEQDNKSDWEAESSPDLQQQSPATSDRDRFRKHLEEKLGMNRTPVDTLKDLGVGAMRGGQNLAAALGQGGQYIANKLTGGYAPQVDIREEMGLGEDRPVDFRELAKSNSPNALLEVAGQYAPAGLTGAGVKLGQAGNALSKIPGGGALANVLSKGTKPAAFMATQNENPLVGAAEGYGGAAVPGTVKALGKVVKAVGSSAKNLPNAFKNVNPKEIAKSVQSSHDILDKEASTIFDTVEKEAVKRGANIVPMNKSWIPKLETYFPKTRSTAELIKKAKNGDFTSLRKVQSELWERAKRKKSSPLSSERDVGEEMLDLRDQINESIAENFKKSGHSDLSDMLKSAMGKYHELKKTYYSHPTVGKLVNKESRKIPKNLMSVLSEDSVPMERVRKHAGESVTKNLALAEKKERAFNDLKKLGIGGGILSGLDWVYNTGKNALK